VEANLQAAGHSRSLTDAASRAQSSVDARISQALASPRHVARVAVSGASGLLGRFLTRLLREKGYDVRGADRDAPPAADGEHVRGDLLDFSVCQRACAGASTLVHAAALQYHSGPPRWGRRRFFDQNVDATHNLTRAALAAGVSHVVMVSSDMVYGLPQGRPLRESDTPRPIGPYGRSKLACERACEAAREQGVVVTILRPRLIVGPGRLGVLTRLFDAVRDGRAIPLIGRGHNRYQMVSVEDVARACLLAVQTRPDGTFNLGSNDSPPVRVLLTELCRRAGSRARPLPTPAWLANTGLWGLHALRAAPLSPEQFRLASVDYVLDTSRAAEQLGWRPLHSDAEMLWQAYQSYVGRA
jgi:dTDP-glucose 4,6-dehydratase